MYYTKRGEIVYNFYYSKLLIILVFVSYVRTDTDEITPSNDLATLFETHETLFEDYLRKYNHEVQVYTPKKRHEVLIIFRNNLVLLDYFKEKQTTAKFGVNRFTGITFERFTNGYTGFNGSGLTDDGVVEFDPSDVKEMPVTMDWSDVLYRSVQHYCKNSYALSAVGNIQARYFAWIGRPIELSERQAFECDQSGNCLDGGVPHKVFQALQDTGGVSLTRDYPNFKSYHIVKQECNTKKTRVVVQIKGYIRLKVKKESDLIPLLVKYGPVCTSIKVTESLKNYQGGIYDPDDCDMSPTDHAVLLTGYGYDNKLNISYWTILNSWGEDWGESGYFRLIRGKFACNFAREYIATAVVEPNDSTMKDRLALQNLSFMLRQGQNVTGMPNATDT